VIRFAADENFNNDIVRGVRQRDPTIDLVRVQDASLSGADDPTVLAWAATEGRVLLTHDVRTMSRYAWDRVAAGERMPGVLEARPDLSVGQAVDEILIVAACSTPDEWADQVRYLPLR
jgi:hypothetical protein